MEKILKNKVALITGGSRGIGKAIAEAYLREGAKVMLVARSREELKAAKGELKKFGEVESCPADVSRAGDVKAAVEATFRVFGRIDVLVNGAGAYGPIGPSEEVDFEKWKNTFEINVFGTFRMMQEVIPHMQRQKSGKIINFSGGGDTALPRFSAYHASKGAIVRLTETIAAEVKEYGIEVNCFAPGAVNTKFLDEALAAGEEKVGKERYEKLLKQKAEGGVSPEKAAALCVFLASSASDGLTGKFLSAVWDEYPKWGPKEIAEIMKTDQYTMRRKV
ncbi:MAG: SDR family oxidoreductase [Candidatus Liptonbacteria bacterium]|nr:SDR family oxidoreductase [Candidatus Liptonbacteria bacterium]